MKQVKTRFLAMALTALALTSCVGTPNTGTTDPATAATHYQTGLSLLQARQYKEAKAELTKAQPFKTGDENALFALAIASDMEGDYRTSDRAYDELAKSGSDPAMLYNNMGYSHMLRGDLEQALLYLTEAARRKPDDPIIRNNIAMLRGVMPAR